MHVDLPLSPTDGKTAAAHKADDKDGSAVVTWLLVVYLMILAMVVVGGTTRLTGSGLSMVDWHPLMGAIPPTSDAEWDAVFRRYQDFPQYKLVNGWMDVHAFKKIFFWEYMHRLLGRVIGLAVFLPWLYFFVTKKLSRRTNVGALVALLLGGLQGVLGWYMVKSGLVDVPAVSHFRLAAHLLLAFVCSQWVLWMVLDLRAPWRAWSTAPRASAPFPRATLPLSLLALLYVQIVYGAFVAGKRAGFMSSTFPDMNGYYLPQAFFTSPSFVDDLFNNPLSLHYIHRLIGTLTLATFVGAGVLLYRRAQTSSDRTLGAVLISIVSAQFLLGVLTVVFSVPIPLAVLHQGVAMLLLGAITALLHRSLARPSLS